MKEPDNTEKKSFDEFKHFVGKILKVKPEEVADDVKEYFPDNEDGQPDSVLKPIKPDEVHKKESSQN